MSSQINKAVKVKQGKRGNNRTVMALKRELSLRGVLDMWCDGSYCYSIKSPGVPLKFTVLYLWGQQHPGTFKFQRIHVAYIDWAVVSLFLLFTLSFLGIIHPKLRVPLLLTDPYVIPNLYDVWSSTECQWRSSEECLNCFLQRNQGFSSSKKTMTMFQGCMIVPFKLLFTWALSTQIQLFTKPHLFFMRFGNFSHI